MNRISFRSLIVLAIVLSVLLTVFPRMVLCAIYPGKYSEIVEQCAEEFGVPPEMIYAVIKTESNFRPDAVSSAGAIGLMQIMPSTFLWLAEMMGESVETQALYDPATNIRYGTFFLGYLFRYYQNYKTALAAYNAGMGTVSEWLASERYSQNGELTDIPFDETANYVKKVTQRAKIYKKLY